MKKDVNKTYSRESYELFHMWLLFAALVLGSCALNPVKAFGFDTAEFFCILSLGMIILLYVLVAITGSVYWLPGISYEEAAQVGQKRCRKYAVENLLIYIMALAIYLVYCQRAHQAVVSSPIYSAIAGAGIFCGGILISGKISFVQSGNADLQ